MDDEALAKASPKAAVGGGLMLHEEMCTSDWVARASRSEAKILDIRPGGGLDRLRNQFKNVGCVAPTFPGRF